jgi:uncharacterized protein involved in exopolysaccharide biosynthesis
MSYIPEVADLKLDEHSRLMQKKQQRRNRLSLSIWTLEDALGHELGDFKGSLEQEAELAALKQEKEQLESGIENDVEHHAELNRLHQETCLKHRGLKFSHISFS